MTGLAGASWHRGLTIVATGASGRDGEVRKQCYTGNYSDMYLFTPCSNFCFNVTVNQIFPHDVLTVAAKAPASQQSDAMPPSPSVLSNNLETVHPVLCRDNVVVDNVVSWEVAFLYFHMAVYTVFRYPGNTQWKPSWKPSTCMSLLKYTVFKCNS